MIKVAFLSWHYKTPEVFLDTIIKMTPNKSGKWENIEATTDIDKADFCVVFDGYSGQLPFDRTIYMGQHPDCCPTSFRTWEDKKALLKMHLRKFLNPGEWWISYDYDFLSSLKADFKKSTNLSCIMTYQIHNPMYAQRPAFVQELVKKTRKIELYGRPQEKFENDELLKSLYRGPLGFNKPDGTKGEHLIGKEEVLMNSRYTLEFDVGPTRNYFSERFYDSLLLWCMPIYFGSNNIDKWIPRNAFQYIDINKLEDTDKVIQIVNSDLREWNIDAIAEARDLLLNKYQTWAYVHSIVNNINYYLGKQNSSNDKEVQVI